MCAVNADVRASYSNLLAAALNVASFFSLNLKQVASCLMKVYELWTGDLRGGLFKSALALCRL